MLGSERSYLEKALESLNGAEREFTERRFNNCANRAYYACFQAAIHALIRHGVRPTRQQWSHGFVQAQFVGQLVNRRHAYSADLRVALAETLILREIADYKEHFVSQRDATRVLARSRRFVAAVQEG